MSAPIQYKNVWGLTGGIASGKTAASGIFAELGACIIDCDLVSREIMSKGSPWLAQAAALFGSKIIDTHGELKRGLLGRMVFNDPQKLSQLNELLHPAIWKRTFQLVGEARQRERLVIIAAPLLFEHGVEAVCKEVIVTDVSSKVQIKRLMARDKFNLDEAQRRIGAQMSLAEKAARATILLDNNGSKAHLREQIETLWQERIAPVYGF
ncbi:MAG: dephospho-CoA kinase [bacterium]|nr:dephospho-CoA kinase [bacterium]